MPQSPARLQQIASQLEARYFSILTPLTRQGWTAEQIKQNRLSRSLAAFAIGLLADVDHDIAAASVIDDFDDNGIDAIFFENASERLFLVQAKYKTDGGEPDFAEVKKFTGGVRDLLAERYTRFNEAFQQKLPEVQDALSCAALKVVCVLAWSGNNLAGHATRELEDLKTELNGLQSGRCSIELFTLDKAHFLLAEEQAVVSIDERMTLQNWFQIQSPYKAVYGQISLADLASLYQRHQKRLFIRNIRYYIGLSEVNRSIAKTLREAPGQFFYLNNGLTAVCGKITPLPTARPERGEFEIEGLSIVNGAQTVGSIAGAAQSDPSTPLSGSVLITIIETGSATDDLSLRITQARNHQNQVRMIDFAALDPVQERIRRELAISGIVYHYKPSTDALRRSDTNLAIGEAAVALACFSGKTDLAVVVKKEAGRLLDRNGAIYPLLFPPTCSAVWLSRAVRSYRFLDAFLSSREYGQEKLFYRHMRYFILHIFARRSRTLRRDDLDVSVSDKEDYSRMVDELSTLIFDEVQTFPIEKGWLALSRSLTDSVQLAAKIMTALRVKDDAAAFLAQPPTTASPIPQPPSTPSL